MSERVTVNFDEESYYLDGEYWIDWDKFGEDMADAVNKLLTDLSDENKQLKKSNQRKQKFIDKQNKIMQLLVTQCKDFKEMLDDMDIAYLIDERLEKLFEDRVDLE